MLAIIVTDDSVDKNLMVEMIIKKKTLPNKSKLKIVESSFDYMDSFGCAFSDKENKIYFPEISEAFLKSKSKWVSALMKLRNKIVKPLGLKTSEKVDDKEIQNLKCEKGKRYGIFKVIDKSENEVILGENDKHLNFRISILLDNPTKDTKILTISSIVRFNNWYGRLYFMTIKPFHNIIVPNFLKGILDQIENGKKTNHQHCL